MSTTETTAITYPNREHENADKAAARRALAALAAIEDQVAVLRAKIEHRNYIYGSDTNQITDNARALTEHLAILETLRDVREWHAADTAERNGGPS
jgi:hypothetical protein